MASPIQAELGGSTVSAHFSQVLLHAYKCLYRRAWLTTARMYGQTVDPLEDDTLSQLQVSSATKERAVLAQPDLYIFSYFIAFP